MTTTTTTAQNGPRKTELGREPRTSTRTCTLRLVRSRSKVISQDHWMRVVSSQVTSNTRTETSQMNTRRIVRSRWCVREARTVSLPGARARTTCRVTAKVPCRRIRPILVPVWYSPKCPSSPCRFYQVGHLCSLCWNTLVLHSRPPAPHFSTCACTTVTFLTTWRIETRSWTLPYRRRDPYALPPRQS